ncbi:hypothetical protein BH10ACT1_BH10ACT1_05340 [soil metagenome]
MRPHQVRSYVRSVSNDDRTDEAPSAARHPDHAPHPRYEIRVEGRLDSRWATWFDGMALTNEDDGTTVVRGSVVDQAALHGLLQKLRDLGLHLVAVNELPPQEPTTGPTPAHPEGTRP